MKNPVFVTYNGRRRNIGTFDDDTNTFTKKVQASKHLLKVLDAWGMDGHYFTMRLLRDASNIVVIDTESGIRYSISAIEAKKHGDFMNLGHYAQIFVPRCYWKQEGGLSTK